MEEVAGENPALGGEMLTMVEFNAAIICTHGYTIAPNCAICHRPNWLDCPVRSSESGIQRTVRDVVREFLEAKKIPSVKVARRHVREKRREVRKAARKEAIVRTASRTYKRWGAIAGLAVISGILIYEGGKLVLKLLAEKKERKSG